MRRQKLECGGRYWLVPATGVFLLYGYNFRSVHFVEADMQPDCTSHQQVVMLAYDSSEAAVLALFIEVILCKATLVALDIHCLTNDLDEC